MIGPLPQEFYDDLNARNKAAAEAARAEYEREENERLAAAQDSMEQLAVEDKTKQLAVEGTPEDVAAAVESTPEQIAVASVEASSPIIERDQEVVRSALPAEPFVSDRMEMVGNSTALVVAARSGEEEEEEEKKEEEG